MHEATLLTSAYNSVVFINSKVRNFLATREHADTEMIIVDCNGGKEIEAISPEFRKDPSIITIVYNRRISIWKAVNDAIKLSSAPYVVQANTDDLVHPEAYRKQIDKLNDGYDISYFDYHLQYGYVGEYLEAVEIAYDHYITPTNGYSTGCGLGAFPMWKKSLHEKHGMFDESLEILSDSLFWDTLSKDREIKWGHIPKLLGVYANRGANNLESNTGLLKSDQKKLRNRRGRA